MSKTLSVKELDEVIQDLKDQLIIAKDDATNTRDRYTDGLIKIQELKEKNRQFEGINDALTKAVFDNEELIAKEEKHIKMFASWLIQEGYLIDGEKTNHLDIDRLYSYWNVN